MFSICEYKKLNGPITQKSKQKSPIIRAFHCSKQPKNGKKNNCMKKIGTRGSRPPIIQFQVQKYRNLRQNNKINYFGSS